MDVKKRKSISRHIFIHAVILISIILSFYIVVYLPFNQGIAASISAFPTPNKVLLGDSNIPIEYPWGDAQNLKVYVNLDNVPKDDREYYLYEVLLATKWWEGDTSHNLNYSLNFTMTDNPKEANITFLWNETLYGGREIRGHAYINSSGEFVKTCDPFNPPYTKCNITILSNLSHDENLFVIKHELGHVLGLKHSFNRTDFFILLFGFDSNYLNSRSEIMFDSVLYSITFSTISKLMTIYFIMLIVILTLVAVVLIVWQINQKSKIDKSL